VLADDLRPGHAGPPHSNGATALQALTRLNKESSIEPEPFDAAHVVDFYVGTREPRHNTQFAGARTTMNKSRPSRRKTAADPEGSESNPMVELTPDIKTKIGQQLRLMYGEVVNQGVPDRFVEILRRLDDPTDGGSKTE
jgi:hypothetical protein